jgi:hypothetical protein
MNSPSLLNIVTWMTQRAVHVSLLMDKVVQRQAFLQLLRNFSVVTRLLIILPENNSSKKAGILHQSHPAPSKAVWKYMYVSVNHGLYVQCGEADVPYDCTLLRICLPLNPPSC